MRESKMKTSSGRRGLVEDDRDDNFGEEMILVAGQARPIDSLSFTNISLIPYSTHCFFLYQRHSPIKIACCSPSNAKAPGKGYVRSSNTTWSFFSTGMDLANICQPQHWRRFPECQGAPLRCESMEPEDRARNASPSTDEACEDFDDLPLLDGLLPRQSFSITQKHFVSTAGTLDKPSLSEHVGCGHAHGRGCTFMKGLDSRAKPRTMVVLFSLTCPPPRVPAESCDLLLSVFKILLHTNFGTLQGRITQKTTETKSLRTPTDPLHPTIAGIAAALCSAYHESDAIVTLPTGNR